MSAEELKAINKKEWSELVEFKRYCEIEKSHKEEGRRVMTSMPRVKQADFELLRQNMPLRSDIGTVELEESGRLVREKMVRV